MAAPSRFWVKPTPVDRVVIGVLLVLLIAVWAWSCQSAPAQASQPLTPRPRAGSNPEDTACRRVERALEAQALYVPAPREVQGELMEVQ